MCGYAVNPFHEPVPMFPRKGHTAPPQSFPLPLSPISPSLTPHIHPHRPAHVVDGVFGTGPPDVLNLDAPVVHVLVLLGEAEAEAGAGVVQEGGEGVGADGEEAPHSPTCAPLFQMPQTHTAPPRHPHTATHSAPTQLAAMLLTQLHVCPSSPLNLQASCHSPETHPQTTSQVPSAHTNNIQRMCRTSCVPHLQVQDVCDALVVRQRVHLAGIAGLRGAGRERGNVTSGNGLGQNGGLCVSSECQRPAPVPAPDPVHLPTRKLAPVADSHPIPPQPPASVASMPLAQDA